MTKRLFSGMQPTGELHLGNHVGALKNWVGLLNEYDCIFCVVDYHAITIPYDVAAMGKRVLDAAMDYIAGGLDPERCTIFVQSQVPQHTELTWVFDTVTPLGQLMRMTQFKIKTNQLTGEMESDPEGEDRPSFLDKAGKVNAGLFTYPVLQAADILLYKGEVVPVGEDQVQHIEMTRDIARRFNNRWGTLFPECEPILSAAPRLLGLDGVDKMSKSLGNHVPMQAEPEEVIRLITRESVSDPRRARLTDPGVPEECNIYYWHQIFSGDEEQQWAREGCRSAGIGCFDCKRKLAENVNTLLLPYRERRADLERHPDDVRDVLREGAERCRGIAAETMAEVRQALGLVKQFF